MIVNAKSEKYDYSGYIKKYQYDVKTTSLHNLQIVGYASVLQKYGNGFISRG